MQRRWSSITSEYDWVHSTRDSIERNGRNRIGASPCVTVSIQRKFYSLQSWRVCSTVAAWQSIINQTPLDALFSELLCASGKEMNRKEGNDGR